MRHLWGHGVGHRYSHCDAPDKPPHDNLNDRQFRTSSLDSEERQEEDIEMGAISQGGIEHYQDSLEDLEGEELEVFCDSEGDGSDLDLQEPEDDDENW